MNTDLMQRCHQTTLSQDIGNWMDHMMKVSEAVVFITGANRGLGLAIAREARRQGARKIYVGMRQIGNFQEEGLTPIQLDVNDEASIQQAAEQCADTTILVNNAGIALLNEHPVDVNIITATQKILETNLLGLMRVTQIFAPILKKNQQAYVVNILSDVSWEPSTVLTSYAISKAAAWSYTNSIRQWLSQFNIQVMGVHVGFIDTDLTRSLPIPKIAPETVTQEIFQGIEQNAYEVLVGEKTQQLKQGLSDEVASYLKLKPDQASV